MSGESALAVADWRQRTHDLYAEVRAEYARDRALAHRTWVAGRDALFRHHPATALLPEDRDGFTGLDVPAYDPDWAFEAELEDAEPAHLDVPTGTDGVVPFDRVGVVRLDGVGSLDVWWLGSYGGGFFVPVKDASAGRPGGTYGGGRYLLDTVKGADLGRVGSRFVLDLNFAYNPSCAYDPEWACPLAPAGNTLRVPVPAGERTFHDEP
ncbi:DUF1684 domain-containing protein [Amnibacterium setariae]|uniref:DUF1684 domain-containing protein n=1 Tax=Amnibacterium setariae TaxID=2306585 RepID=A0A3A1U1H1_9MICO|nr:DUF1684 domain-containing protein [Amnibacterium setariae]RIX30190.1 DUF1684 domain-containing protein [Amnibacterium setariae]